MPRPFTSAENGGVLGAASRSALRLQSDRRLVAVARSGSDVAFEAIVRRYREPLLRYSRRLVGPAQAEDVVQQTFLNALRALRRDSRDIELRPWLYTIARNAGLNALAAKPAAWEPLDEDSDGVAQPPEIAERHERIRTLVAGINELPDRQRRAIVLRELEGRSHEEIARDMHATAPVVRQLLHRARTRLRDTCGLLVPLPVLRWVVALQASGGAGTERAGEIAAGAGASGALVKIGAAALATGAIATGTGVTDLARERDSMRHGSAQAATPAPAKSRALRQAAAAAPMVVAAKPARARPDEGSRERHEAGNPRAEQRERDERGHDEDAEDHGDEPDEEPDHERSEPEPESEHESGEESPRQHEEPAEVEESSDDPQPEAESEESQGEGP